jgi:hypothetical protein
MFIISSGPQKYHIITLTDMGLSEGLLNTRNVIQNTVINWPTSSKHASTSSQTSV